MDNNENIESTNDLNGVAIIGMSGRFPNARDIYEFWENLENGVDCIRFYKDEELIEAGIDPEVIKHSDYVKAKGEVENVDIFDASFFGINPREAEVTDPQHRMLLECAWEAMEHAGYDSSKFDGPVGVFAGKSMDYYLLLNVYPRIRREISAGSLLAAIGNDKDSLSTTISYRLNLTGPGITVQTSSSTSLVSVCVACQSLLTYQCDIALAGGVTAGPPIRSGYLFQEGNIWSPDGLCRTFDAKAKGFVPGNGMGLVVLKRLEEALVDGDNIWAVIKGYAVNNDGYNKVSYSAPSVDAQVRVVAEALAIADVHPETIQYIEAHGTGTNLGDPIEMSALNLAFQADTDKKHYCAVGSVKTNIGHLDNAAGIAGLIKTALALKHKKIPPSLHFETPNPSIDWENSPFFVNTQLREWQANTNPDGTPVPRRAGVTSLGMGGTNAHVILEETPLGPDVRTASENSRGYHLILLSAKTPTALYKITENLGNCLEENIINPGNPANPGLNLADVAYTLKMGRRDFNHRRMLLCKDFEDVKTTLENLAPGGVLDTVCNIVERPVFFMFSGQGAQYVNMGKELYQKEPVFKENMDYCAEFLSPLLGIDLRELIYPENEADIEKNAEQLKQTWVTQPVLFMIEYSLARLWMAWGIKPQGMIGHSIGEYTAACVSGCMKLEDALKLVVMRGRLMQNREEGTMLSVVGLGTDEIAGMLGDGLSLAAVNSPKHCVVSGETGAVERLEQQLAENKLFYRRLHTSHAFHSPMMDPIMEEFAQMVSQVKLNDPAIPFISGVTGTWIKAEEARSPQYWAEQLRKPVCFSDGIKEILTHPGRVLLEVGPGKSLCELAAQHKINSNETEPVIFSSLRHIKQNESDMAFLLRTLGNLWLHGVAIDWKNYYKNEKRQRIPLPTYPFERERYWLEEVKEKKQGVEICMETEQAKPVSESQPAPAAIEGEGDKETVTKSFKPRPQLNNEYVAPTSDLERKVVAVWEDILGIKPIGIQDNFFDLGGHSLLATLFLSRLQEELGIRLELKSIFENPHIAAISALVESEENKTEDIKDIETLVNEIEGLSQEELQMALSEEKLGDQEQ
jgi:phthiocerol/phenolphthiocerol synthesis type-I polyketide synthase E